MPKDTKANKVIVPKKEFNPPLPAKIRKKITKVNNGEAVRLTRKQ